VLGFAFKSDVYFVSIADLINLESLNLDSCKIGDEGLLNLKGNSLDHFSDVGFELGQEYMQRWIGMPH